MNNMLKLKLKDERLQNEKALKNAAMGLLVIGTLSSIVLAVYLCSLMGWVGVVIALLNEVIVYAAAYLLTVIAEISTTLKNKN